MVKVSLLGFFLLVFSDTHAFTLISEHESSFVNPEVAIDFTSRGDCSALGMTVNEVFDLVMESVDKYWNRVPHCRLNLVRGNMVDIPIDGIDIIKPILGTSQLRAVIERVANNRILVGCNAESFDSPRILAAGTIANNRGLVFINASSESYFRTSSRNERLAVLAHEIGHAFGLGHSSEPVALMYYSTGGKVQEKLTTDDFDGCAYLYPNDFPGSCSMIPYLNSDREGGDDGKMFWMALLLGFALVVALNEGVSRLWRN